MNFADNLKESFLDIYSLAEYIYCQRSSFYFISGFEDGQEENLFIQRGRDNHSKIDLKGKRYRGSYREIKSVSVSNNNYKIKGKTDLIRLYKNFAVPVEYKSGIVCKSDFHKFQLFLQGICIEEQLSTKVNEGIVYFYRSNKTLKYKFSFEYRTKAVRTIKEVREKLELNKISNFKQLNKYNCINCSFFDICMPKIKKL